MNLKVPEKRAVWKDYLLIYNIRKYPQISQSDVYVEVQKNRIVELTSSVKKCFYIEFLGHMSWQILYNNDFIMQYKDGRYYIVNPSINQNTAFFGKYK